MASSVLFLNLTYGLTLNHSNESAQYRAPTLSQKSPSHRLGRRRLESHHPLTRRRQTARPRTLHQRRRHGQPAHLTAGALTDAVDLDRHRQTPL